MNWFYLSTRAFAECAGEQLWEDKHVGTQIRRQPEVMVTLLA